MAYDIVIAGGGLAGQIQALALVRSGWHVAVLERGSGVAALKDPRNLALSVSSRRVLQTLGVWDALAAQCVPVTHIDVSRRGAFGTTCLRATDEGLAALGYVVSAARLAQVLQESLRSLYRCDFLMNTEVEEASDDDEIVQLRLSSHGEKKPLAARALVVADGAQSKLRDALGLETHIVDYGQSAVVAEVRLDREAQGWAYERFTAQGPLALLPCLEGKRALVWAQSHREALRVGSMDDAQFCQNLQQVLGRRAGQVTEAGPRHLYRLAFPRAAQRVAGRCVLIGDAACSFHPVAAQGFNLVIRDAAWLTQHIEGVSDPGDPQVLEQYAKDREKDVLRVAVFTDFLALGFMQRHPLARGLQALGMMMLAGIPAMRTRLVRFGMGASLRRPKLALPRLD